MSTQGLTTDGEALFHTQTKLSVATRGILEQGSGAEVVRAKVDQRIRELEAEIIYLKSHRNTTASTSCLPAEILSQIFIAYATSVATTPRSLSWLRATHVCRHWRTVAMDCPAVWTRVAFHCKPPLLELMLSRSRMAPLIVRFDSGGAAPLESLKKVMSQPERIRSLEIVSYYRTDLFTQDMDRNILSKFSGAKVLQTVIIKGSDSGIQSRSFIGPGFLEGLNDSPALYRLEVTGCNFTCDTIPAIAGLAHLHLMNKSEHRPLPDRFLESLAAMPRLETLDLSGMLPRENYSPRLASVPLPALKSLKLQGSIIEITQFFTAIQIPSDVPIQLTVDDRYPTNLSPFMASIKASSNSRNGVQELLIKFSGTHGGLGFSSCFSNRPHVSTPSVDSSIPADITVSFLWPFASDCDTLPSVIDEHFSLLPLRSLSLEGHLPGWIESMSRLPQLTTIRIKFMSPEAFIDTLNDDPAFATEKVASPAKPIKRRGGPKLKAKANQPKVAPCFPALKKIRFDQVNFEASLDDDSLLIIKLAEALKKRRRPYKVEEVGITDATNFCEVDCDRLEAVVKVEWDGLESMDESDDDDDDDEFGSSGEDDDYYHGHSCQYCSL